MDLMVGINNAFDFVNGQYINLGDHAHLGVTEASIKNLEGKNTAINGSNMVQGFIRENSVPSIDLTVNAPSEKALQAMLGEQQTTDNGGFLVPGDISPVNFLAITTPIYSLKKEMLMLFPACRVTFTTLDLKTNTETKKNTVPVKLTFDAANSDLILGSAWAHKNIDSGTALQVLQDAFNLSTANQIEGDYPLTDSVNDVTTPTKPKSN